MDIFGERIFRNEKQRLNHQKKITEIQTIGNKIPSAVKTAYIPSGSFDFLSIPKLIIAGTFGHLAGYLIAGLLVLLCVGVFIAFKKIGSCADVCYVLAALGYFLAPSLIGPVSASIIGRGAKWARCRLPLLVAFTAFVFGLFAAIDSVFSLEDMLIKYAFSFWVNVKNGPFNTLPYSMKRGIARPLILVSVVLINLIIPPIIAYRFARKQKFCETCGEYLTEKCIKRLAGHNIHNLLLGLLEGNKDCFSNLDYLPLTGTLPANCKNWIEVILCSCSKGKTNFIEVNYYWMQQVEKRSEQKKQRFVYSGEFSQDQIDILKKLLETF